MGEWGWKEGLMTWDSRREHLRIMRAKGEIHLTSNTLGRGGYPPLPFHGKKSPFNHKRRVSSGRHHVCSLCLLASMKMSTSRMSRYCLLPILT